MGGGSQIHIVIHILRFIFLGSRDTYSVCLLLLSRRTFLCDPLIASLIGLLALLVVRTYPVLALPRHSLVYSCIPGGWPVVEQGPHRWPNGPSDTFTVHLHVWPVRVADSQADSATCVIAATRPPPLRTAPRAAVRPHMRTFPVPPVPSPSNKLFNKASEPLVTWPWTWRPAARVSRQPPQTS